MKFSKIQGLLVSFVVFAGIATVAMGEDFTEYVGTQAGASNSWLDADSWPQFSGYPDGGDDTAVLDNSNTYADIDSADVEIGSLTVAKTATDVEVEISVNRKLTVNGNVVVAETQGSSAKMSLMPKSELQVGGDLKLGDSGGSGTLQVDGGSVMVQGELTIGSSFEVELQAGAKVVEQGDRLDSFAEYLTSARIIPNTGMQTYAIFDVTNDATVLRGPPNGSIRSLSCPTADDFTVVTAFNDGDTLEIENSGSGQLCALVEVSSDGVSSRRMLESGTAQLEMIPLGRSYSEHDWEPYGGVHSAMKFDCDEGICQVTLPAPADGRSY
ncbi:MAG: hypothetical protein SGILL_000638, partial [Bacillariaceae sp.]